MTPKKPQDVEKTTTISIAGFSLPMPRWTKTAFGVIAVALIGFLAYFQIEDHFHKDKVRIPKSAMIQLQEAQRHVGEDPDIAMKVTGTGVSLKHFPSDDCYMLLRDIPGSFPVIHWMVNSKNHPELVETISPMTRSSDSFLAAPVFAGNPDVPCSIIPEQHGSPNQSWYGDPAPNDPTGCWRQAWWRWADECQGYRWVNTCDGRVDPAFHWTVCQH